MCPNFFVGRTEQVQTFVERVRRSLAGRAEVIFISGERGIGKTSLAQFAHLHVKQEFKVAGSHAHLEGITDTAEAIRRSVQHLVQESHDKPWHRQLLKLLREHVRQVGLFGMMIEFTPPPDLLESTVRHFPNTLRQLFDAIHSKGCNGLLLIWDDINGLVQRREFADWLKSVVDELAFEKVPICLVLVGLAEVRHTLIRNNESLARVLFPLDVPLWNENECAEFFHRAFQQVNVQVTESALKTMTIFSGGHPALAHEVGDAVLRVDDDNVIDDDDVSDGIVQAAEIIGRKYLEPQVYQAIRSPRYRKILRILASDSNNYAFQRTAISQGLSSNERRVFDNFLRRMRRLGVIIPDEERGRGAYRFRNLLHFFYFAMESARRPRS